MSTTRSTADLLSLEQSLERAGWPSSLADASYQPHVVDDVATFQHLLLYGSHVDRIIVLRDGVCKLGLEQSLPAEVSAALADGQACVRSFLQRLGDDKYLRQLRGRVYCTPADDASSEETELKRLADGTELDTLADKRAALGSECSPSDSVYIGELRHTTKYRHPADNRWSKSLLSRGVCDAVGRARAMAMPYWDRYDEGVFVGGVFGGSPLHVDQILWSNVGKNMHGQKLLAIWPYGQASRDMFDAHAYSLFRPRHAANPLPGKQADALKAAAQVALLGPGDVVVFHGGNAHMALSVSESLSVTAYESFMNLDRTNLAAFLDTGTSRQYRQCRARQPILDDIKGEVSESLNELCEDLEDGAIDDCELERHAPDAIATLRADPLIGRKVAPLRPRRCRRRLV